jgi:hypothetical protein
VFDLVGSLYHNGVGPKGAEALAEALKTNSALQTLEYGAAPPLPKLSAASDAACSTLLRSLEDNNLQAEGAKHVSEALKVNTTLQTLEYAAAPPFPAVSSRPIPTVSSL